MRPANRRTLGPLLALVLLATPVLPDEIHLKGGGRVSGRIVERTESRVAIETGPGRVTLPLSRVERIVEGRSALETFAERAEGLEAGDVAGWADLARWAEGHDLFTQARLAWQRVLAVDPGHPEANAGLGRVAVGGTWMSADDAYRARGYVSYQGRWVTPAEHEAALREDEARLAREADMRVREAEARMEEAEARAREAEAAAEQTTGGIPFGYAYGGYGYGYGGGYGYGSGYGSGYGGLVMGRPGRPGYSVGSRHRTHIGGRDPAVLPSRGGRHTGSPSVRPTPTPRESPRHVTRSSQPRPRPAGILPPQASTTPKR